MDSWNMQIISPLSLHTSNFEFLHYLPDRSLSYFLFVSFEKKLRFGAGPLDKESFETGASGAIVLVGLAVGSLSAGAGAGAL